MGPAPDSQLTRPIRWQHGELSLLDQRLLPAEERWLQCRTVEDVARAIETLAVRGAPAIGIAAACAIALAAREAPPDQLDHHLTAARERLRATRPTAVNLGWALDRTASCRAQGGDADALARLAQEILDDQLAADRAMAAHGAALLHPGDRVLTHCNTGPLATGGLGTALGVIVAGWQAGRVAHAFADETRPLLQGARLTMWELQRAGVPCTLVTDSSAGLLMSRGLVDAVIVGADRIAANGDVANKIGTYPLAVLADRHDVPFYVAAPVSTIDPDTPDGARIPIERRDPGEVTAFGGRTVAPAGAAALNFAFDVTPAELVRAIVTEAGVLRAPLQHAIAEVCAATAATP